MTLKFPNTSRTYNQANHSVRFGGYDSVFEVSFEVDASVLLQLGAATAQDEAAALAVFDSNLDRIQKAANTVYARRRERFHRLSPADF